MNCLNLSIILFYFWIALLSQEENVYSVLYCSLVSTSNFARCYDRVRVIFHCSVAQASPLCRRRRRSRQSKIGTLHRGVTVISTSSCAAAETVTSAMPSRHAVAPSPRTHLTTASPCCSVYRAAAVPVWFNWDAHSYDDQDCPARRRVTLLLLLLLLCR